MLLCVSHIERCTCRITLATRLHSGFRSRLHSRWQKLCDSDFTHVAAVAFLWFWPRDTRVIPLPLPLSSALDIRPRRPVSHQEGLLADHLLSSDKIIRIQCKAVLLPMLVQPFLESIHWRSWCHITWKRFVSDIAIFVLKRDVKLQLTN